MSDETTLLPCPFCGGEAEKLTSIDGFTSIGCLNCNPFYGVMIQRNTEAEAIAAWNTRAAKPCYATDHTHDGCKYSVNRGWVENVAHGTLTAEQVREAIEEAKAELLESCEYVGTMSQRQSDVLKAFGKMEQAIADELNAELGGGNCARCAEDMGRYADSLCDPLKERIAELLRCLENDWHINASWDGLRKFWCVELTELGVKLRDAELNARAERTCEIESEFWNDHGGYDSDTYEWKLSCGHSVEWLDKEPPKHCPECGAKVVVG